MKIKKKKDLIYFNIFLIKKKFMNYFMKENLYSEIFDKEFYLLPIFVKKMKKLYFFNNYFYKIGIKLIMNDLIEFILPLENIEIIQKINKYRNNLLI